MAVLVCMATVLAALKRALYRRYIHLLQSGTSQRHAACRGPQSIHTGLSAYEAVSSPGRQIHQHARNQDCQVSRTADQVWPLFYLTNPPGT